MVTEADFRPAPWLPGPHAQTLWASLVRRPCPALRRERLELPDGDFLDLDWTADRDGPLVLLLHGLEGSSDSGYARGLLAALTARGWRGVVLHFRGCSGEPNRLARSYCAGCTEDLDHVIERLHRREPDTLLAAVGYSLGGNMLLKWLGERGGSAPLRAAVAVSVPFLLECAARRMTEGFSRLYQWHLLRACKASYRTKFAARADAPLPLEQLDRLRDFFQFDDRITAPLHGYAGVEDYYRRASCRSYLRGIYTPTLILHALDDPFMSPDAVPKESELGPGVTLELSPRGGHVGFVERGGFWLERRIPAFLETCPGAAEFA
jgi:uncharacterized protein